MHGAYVYIVFDRDAVPRYVGKGKGNRWRVHRSASHNKELARLIKESDAELPIVIVRQGISDDEAYDLEVALIAAIGRGDRGPLLNLSDGGWGIGAHTPESKAKLRAARKGKPVGKQPEETRAKMSASHTGLKHSLECCAAIGRAHKGKIVSTETRAKMSASAKARTDRDKQSGIPCSEIRREAIRKALTKFWAQRREAGLPLRHSRGQDKAR